MSVPRLWEAILSGDYDFANLMISRGTDVNETTRTVNNPVTTLLHYAVAKKRDAECIRMLAKFGANFNARDSWNRTPLHWAAVWGAGSDVVEVLINNGAFVDARDHKQWTPLHHYALEKRFPIESVQKLIDRGAIGANDWSVLHVAVCHDNLEMVKMLISHGVSIDTKNNGICTPLLCYLSFGFKPKTDIIQLLLENGARVNEVTNTGSTALHVACEKELVDMVALLLEFGADFNVHNQAGKTPFELLRNSPSSEAITQIIIKEAVKREALGQCLSEGYKQMAQSRNTYSRIEQECREEIKRMQTEKIDAEDSVTLSKIDSR